MGLVQETFRYSTIPRMVEINITAIIISFMFVGAFKAWAWNGLFVFFTLEVADRFQTSLARIFPLSDRGQDGVCH